MIRTKGIVVGIKDIPSDWCFEHLLGLNTRLSGQQEKIKSPFTNERTPSFTLYVGSDQKYRYKDFSSGLSGTHIELAFELKKKTSPTITKGQVISELISIYQNYLKTGDTKPPRDFKIVGKYQVDGQILRNWNADDKNFWGKFHISTKTREFFNIAAIESFTMSKEVGEEKKQIRITRPLCYGYFDKQGGLYKIYQPDTPNIKFIKVLPHIQGEDQLQGRENLLITKSLKDCASFYELGFKTWDTVACDSENTLLPAKYIAEKKKRYKNIVTLMDADEAGRTASEKYKEQFGLPYIELKMSKDLSDSCRDFDVEKVKEKLIKLLNV